MGITISTEMAGCLRVSPEVSGTSCALERDSRRYVSKKAPTAPEEILSGAISCIANHARRIRLLEVESTAQTAASSLRHHSELPFWHLTSDGFWDLELGRYYKNVTQRVQNIECRLDTESKLSGRESHREAGIRCCRPDGQISADRCIPFTRRSGS